MPDTSMEALSKLRSAFIKDGTVTAGNASSLNDGGSALIMMNMEKAKKMGVRPIARVIASAPGSIEPSIMGMGVVEAVRKAVQFAGMEQNQIDYWEFNEAFAAQVLGVNSEFKIDLERLNGVGSGIALGHPVGATGARLMVTLINEMKQGAFGTVAPPYVLPAVRPMLLFWSLYRSFSIYPTFFHRCRIPHKSSSMG